MSPASTPVARVQPSSQAKAQEAFMSAERGRRRICPRSPTPAGADLFHKKKTTIRRQDDSNIGGTTSDVVIRTERLGTERSRAHDEILAGVVATACDPLLPDRFTGSQPGRQRRRRAADRSAASRAGSQARAFHGRGKYAYKDKPPSDKPSSAAERGGKQLVTASDSDSTHANDRGGTKYPSTKEADTASAAAVGDGVICRQ
ncbi:hypothetical protein IscW_ISCW021943 [Ixodes scapularis]|uniref:Uncharacterized protein n=1 Tax=Ixodes scapularis TaxID=6945 RepID=B7QFW6_IXOSC|nr:hypothetical protein IscW_ISCW021943 [Ixodes scapularis]|eukprot:XP_002401028.1 hypothetical protein IscW_ISCW021943 [Ixodes scapularis]